MNQSLYQEAIEYELLTQAIYQSILYQEGNNIEVEHNIELTGRSGVKHQIDVLWRFSLGGVQHTVLIECKNYASNLTLEKVRNFFGVLHDIGNANGVMVTKTGYQSGTADFANYYGIDLKILREPNEEDWEGLIKNILINITSKTPISTHDKPLELQMFLAWTDEEERLIIEKLKEKGRLNVNASPHLQFLDEEGNVSTDELRWWLPKQLNVLEKAEGGPYTQEIEMIQKYILVNEGEPDETLILVKKIVAKYYVETSNEEVIIHGEQVVESILKDFNSGEIEYVKRHS